MRKGERCTRVARGSRHPPTMYLHDLHSCVWKRILSLGSLARAIGSIRDTPASHWPLLEQWPVTNHPLLYLEAIKYAWRFLFSFLLFSSLCLVSTRYSFSTLGPVARRVNSIRATRDTFRSAETEIRPANWNLSSCWRKNPSSSSTLFFVVRSTIGILTSTLIAFVSLLTRRVLMVFWKQFENIWHGQTRHRLANNRTNVEDRAACR